MLTVAMAIAICFIPPVCSLGLLVRYRTVSERVITYVSLGLSLFWLFLAGDFIMQMLKRP
jgi:hypothetical protein